MNREDGWATWHHLLDLPLDDAIIGIETLLEASVKILRYLSILLIYTTFAIAVCLGMDRKSSVQATSSVQLRGEAARIFLEENGLFNQIVADVGTIPSQSQTFSSTVTLTVEDEAVDNSLKISVALGSDTLLVGIPDEITSDINGLEYRGAVYVFIRDGDRWRQQQKLINPEEVGSFDIIHAFANSVALDKDTALVSNPYIVNLDEVSYAVGKVYVYVRSGERWTIQQVLEAPDAARGFQPFGEFIALDGNTALISDNGARVNGFADRGAAYVFERNDESWSQQQQLIDSNGAVGDNFGVTVALDSETAVIGANRVDIGGNENQGAVHIFTRQGGSWGNQQTLVADDGAAGDELGTTTALDGGTVLVGASKATVYGKEKRGAVYVFTHSAGSWNLQQKLTPRDDVNEISEPERCVADDVCHNTEFGYSVALDEETALVGGLFPNYGSSESILHVFVRAGGTWSEQQTLAQTGNFFGSAMALDGKTAMIGNVLFERAQVPQSISFPLPSDVEAGYPVGATVLLAATASSGLLVSFRSETLDVCTISSGTIALLGVGRCQVVANQAGNAIYEAALEASVEFNVVAAATAPQPSLYLPLVSR